MDFPCVNNENLKCSAPWRIIFASLAQKLEPSLRYLPRNLTDICTLNTTNIVVRKLPSWHPLGKQNIQLPKCASSRLRQAEVCPHEGQECSRAPDEPRITLQIPL